MRSTINTERLVIRPWRDDDVTDALAIYGSAAGAHRLSPAMRPITNEVAMQEVLHRWQLESEGLSPVGHWGVEHHDSGRVVGGISLAPLPPDGHDLSIAWQLAPAAWARGFATEAVAAVVRWVMERGDAEELFTILRPRNVRAAATARRIGMEWAGETEKYYGLRLQTYRIRNSDLADTDRGAMAAEDPLPF